MAIGCPANAGDILRGGAARSSSGGAASYGTNPAAVEQARANAKDALARTTQAVQAVRAMQEAARKVAVGRTNLGLDPNHPGQQLPTVPNGLGLGGLQVAPKVPLDLAHPVSGEDASLWTGANLPTQIVSKGKTTVTIKQTAQQALLNWQTFNIGKDTTLNFDQSLGGNNTSEWIAFNKINDPSGSPSQILGKMNAQGQVYVINQNGIIFGGASQINLHSLVASSLPINDNLINRGLLNNPDLQFLFSQLPISTITGGSMPAFNPPASSNTPGGINGDIVVQAGAELSSPTSADHVGGKIALIGQKVSNSGKISTPDGQAILAAGKQVGLAAHASSDPSLRGLDVSIGKGGGAAVNELSGFIDAPRGNITLAGAEVYQLGIAQSTTSVSLNGRIDLLASHNAVRTIILSKPRLNPTATGPVVLGEGSVTQILPEWSSSERVVGTRLALPSQINLQGSVVHAEKESILLAPNGNLEINAGTWLASSQGSIFSNNSGQIYLDQGAWINVAGSVDVEAPVSENIVSAQIRGAETADSPLQRFGIFRGQTVNIDTRETGIYNGTAWVGTPLFNASGYVGLIQRSVGELTTAGGNITFKAGESVVMQKNSRADVSGGWINYQGGMVETTKVLIGGHLYDISKVTPDQVYDGIYTGRFTSDHPKFGISETFLNPLMGGARYENGYRFGANAGAITISAPSVALDGDLLGRSSSGPRQRNIGPTPGTLSLTFQKQDTSTASFPFISPTPPKITFDSQRALTSADPFLLDALGKPVELRADRKAEVLLSPSLVREGGFGVLNIDNSDGDITVPAGVALELPALSFLNAAGSPQGGTISFKAANAEIFGRVTAPGGNLSFSQFDISPALSTQLSIVQGSVTPAADPSRGHFSLGTSAVLSTAGLVVDDRPGSRNGQFLPLVTNGGTISINSFSAQLSSGAVMDVSGGINVTPTGKQIFGAAGNIEIKTGQDLQLASVLGGTLELGATLRGFSGGKGGTLSIQSPLIEIGAFHAANALHLPVDFFSQGGFAGYVLTGLGAQTGQPDQFLPALSVAPGITLAPKVKSWVAIQDPARGNAIQLTPMLKPEGIRTPVALSFNAPGVTDPFSGVLILRGGITIGTGSVISTDAQTDPSRGVTFSGNTVALLGSVFVPGGSITVAGGSRYLTINSEAVPLPTVDLGPKSVLSAAGAALLTPDLTGRGYRIGNILGGGNITVSGNIVAEKGARIDVSGASGVLDLNPGYGDVNATFLGSLNGAVLRPVQIDSNGGSITLKGSQELFTDATLLGAPGGPKAFGGTLSISSGRFYAPGAPDLPTPLDVTLRVTQSDLSIPADFYPKGQSAIGHAVTDANGSSLAGLGYFAVDRFQAGGFNSLTLKGTVEFSGPVSIRAGGSLSVADAGIIFADPARNTTISLTAPYVRLGTPFLPPVAPDQQPVSVFKIGSNPFYFAPTYGSASLTVTADLIDLGSLSLQNIGKAQFLARKGDIRGDGTLDIAGDLWMTAGQIYPPTGVNFTIAVYDYSLNGTLNPGHATFAGGRSRQLPLSAGGQISVYGSIIDQGGVLRAPNGSLNLGWDGTGSAPFDLIAGGSAPMPTTTQLNLLDGSVTSVSGVDPASRRKVVVPYGTNFEDTSWIDPAGTDITVAGSPEKAINISAKNVAEQKSALVDIRGGGDLFATRWVSGNGGTKDILASSSSFAVLPDYGANYSPIDPGYSNNKLGVGDRVYLGASDGLPAGVYTLLPARFALLPGAFLVTPRVNIPVGTRTLPDGATIVSGYRFNDLGAAKPRNSLVSSFEVASGVVIRARAEYHDISANAYLTKSRPADSGHLIFNATQSMSIQGQLASQAAPGGRGGLVDVSSPVDIFIGAKGASAAPGALFLDSADLSAFKVQSLLIGGLRQTGAGGTTLMVKTGRIEVDNADSPLTGPEIILAASKSLILDPGAAIIQSGNSSNPAATLLIGDATKPGSGNGVLLRVTGDSTAEILRSGISNSTVPTLTIGAGARIEGESITLDSTYATLLDPGAKLEGETIALNSGQISLQLNDPDTLLPTSGLILSGVALDTLQNSAKALTLLSYTSLDIYGTGFVGGLDSKGAPTFESLTLHAAEIRGFNNDGGTVSFAAKKMLLDNASSGSVPGAVTTVPSGTLVFNADQLRLGANQLQVDQYANLVLNAAGGILGQGAGGLKTQGALDIFTPVIVGVSGASQSLIAAGALTIQKSATPVTVSGGLGASLTLTGQSLTANSDIQLPSGLLSLRATDGDLNVGDGTGSKLDVGGVARQFYDRAKYTDGGQISLVSEKGNVNLASNSTLNVAANSNGGNAGLLAISAKAGAVDLSGAMLGTGGAGGQSASFTLDVLSLPSVSAINLDSVSANFNLSRSFRVRTGDVQLNGLAKAHRFSLSADQGAITVGGSIDASGATGGSITLAASGNVVLSAGAILTVAAQDFDHAGKGGTVSLETTQGRISLSDDSDINLSVAANNDASKDLGHFTGTLHLRAPQVGGPDYVAIDGLSGNIVDASRITVEGFFAQDANSTGIASIDGMQAAAYSNATAFMGNASAIQARLLAGNTGLADRFHVVPGEEISNSKGDLVLNNDWDLSTWRFGTQKAVVDQSGSLMFDSFGNQIFSRVESGVLSLRAKGTIAFNGSLSDGFGSGAGAIDTPTDSNGYAALWLQKLLPTFEDGSAQRSWSYRITSGADFSAADYHQVRSLANLEPNSGSIKLGRDGGVNISNPFGANALVDSAINSPNGVNHYQVIRTGAGDIDIAAGRNVELLNQFATIYTAGAQVADPSLGGTFDIPLTESELGLYAPQYSMGGGNVSITAQSNILHQTLSNVGAVTADSERQLPNNWLYRRGFVNAAGEFGRSILGDVASTTWWVDFSNFFEGVGALGGGNVSITAGNDVSNVDAVIPTNARMAKGTPDSRKLVEFGGGDLMVRAGNNIDGGVYYVERGDGNLNAGNQITTNSTRSASLGSISKPATIFPPKTWLPTTLFLGKGSFDVSARSDLLLGPVANAFLLPQGINNSYFYKTYFSTYAASDSVSVTSLGGAVTFRQSATMPGDSAATPLLSAWLQRVLLSLPNTVTVSYYQPWLRLAETNVTQFSTVSALMPGTIKATAFSGDINLVGNLTLSPSPTGSVDFVSAGAINGLQPNGTTTIGGKAFTAWGYSQIDLSDANPDAIPGFATPFAYQNVIGTNENAAATSNLLDFTFINKLFQETGSTLGAAGVLQTKQSLHGPGTLHHNDPDPLYLYAGSGDISGLTLFSGKAAHIISGRDITDVAFYLQNNNTDDISLIASGRDIVASNQNSPLRTAVSPAQNVFNVGSTALNGDLQISGPGTLEILAGRNVDLGVGSSSSNGTGVGITSIGNGRNPYLPFAGANIVVAAGIGTSSGLESSQLDFKSFIATYIADPVQGSRYFSELGSVEGVSGALTLQSFLKLTPEKQDLIALEIFYLVLRDAGRDRNDPAKVAAFGNYNAGFSAIMTLFPEAGIAGDILTQSRDIRTKSGGSISLLAPGGNLTLASSISGSPLAPPGIVTESGGDISIFTDSDVKVGVSRIFTLRGGDIMIWSSAGSIAAGASAKTLQSAPPTRVLVDPQSGDIKTDLAGLATGGGIGVLATVVGVPPGDVDLIAPAGTIDAGDAGIRVSGNINIAAATILNAGNIQAGGASAGVPSTVVAAPNLGGLTAAANTVGATTSSAAETAKQQARSQQSQPEEAPSIITVEVIGYGGGDDEGA